jgi:hypothetical protein
MNGVSSASITSVSAAPRPIWPGLPQAPDHDRERDVGAGGEQHRERQFAEGQQRDPQPRIGEARRLALTLGKPSSATPNAIDRTTTICRRAMAHSNAGRADPDRASTGRATGRTPSLATQLGETECKSALAFRGRAGAGEVVLPRARVELFDPLNLA